MSDKLSDNLWVGADYRQVEKWTAEARALEERVAGLERERKEFQLETQRKEIECNELASEVVRLRGEVWHFNTMAYLHAEARQRLEKIEGHWDTCRLTVCKLCEGLAILDSDEG